MKWLIPAKTFLVGEYVALQGGPALILTTSPCFEVILTEIPGLHGLHQHSPAGKFWRKQEIFTQGLAWYDPYQGLGGLGASSAQFLGAYAASQSASSLAISIPELLETYLQSAWQGIGSKPSGYDVLAQHLQGCAYIHHEQKQYITLTWPFQDLAFILLRTGVKIPTHEHLNALDLKGNLNELMETAAAACQAFQTRDRHQLIEAVCAYHEQLKKRQWVAPNSLQSIEFLKTWLNPLAIKGCGAMGADVLLLLVAAEELDSCIQRLTSKGWSVLATNRDLCQATQA